MTSLCKEPNTRNKPEYGTNSPKNTSACVQKNSQNNQKNKYEYPKYDDCITFSKFVQNKAYEDWFLELVSKYDTDNTYFITLTYQNKITGVVREQYLERDEGMKKSITRNFERFHKKFSRFTYGKAYARHGKAIKSLPAKIEFSEIAGMHVHFICELPAFQFSDCSAVTDAVNQLWPHGKIHVRKADDLEGSIDASEYAAKIRTTIGNYGDSFILGDC